MQSLEGSIEIDSAESIERAVPALVVRAAAEVDFLAGLGDDRRHVARPQAGLLGENARANPGSDGACRGRKSEIVTIERFSAEERADGRRCAIGRERADDVVRVVARRDAEQLVAGG